MARLIEERLDRIGFEKVSVDSGGKAVEWLDQVDPQTAVLGLVDLHLPGEIPGPQLGHHFTRDYEVPFLFLADSAEELQAPPVLASQPHGYVLKSGSESELRATLTLAWESIGERQESREPVEPVVVAPSSDVEATLITDLAGRLTYMNTLAEDLTGWTLAEARNQPYDTIFRLIDAHGQPLPHEPMAPGRDPSTRVHAVLAPRTGPPINIQERTSSLTHGDGSLAGLFIGFGPASKTAPETNAPSLAPRSTTPPPGSSSAESEANANVGDPNEPGQAMLLAVSDPLLAVNRQGKLTFLNPQAAQLLGDAGTIGSSFWGLFPPAVREEHEATCARAFERQQACQLSFRDVQRDCWIEALVYPYPDGLLLLLRDITERRKAQERASRLEKLESLGLLARGFAHDFNNLLTVLLGNVSLARYAQPGDASYAEPLEAAKQATEQARNLVQQLLTFAKGGAPITEKIDLNQGVISEVFAAHPRKPHLTYHLDLTSHPTRVDADPGQIRRLLQNLIENAEEAMLGGGQLRISSRWLPTHDPERFQMAANLDPKTDYVLLEVHDTGEGIPDSHADKVFEPYFSTRSDANATGLGLTVCDSIARAHNGFLALQSEYGSHTTARLFLPALQQDWSTAQPQSNGLPNRKMANTPPRILVLDDERPIRVLMSITLKKDGHEVVETEEGSQTVAAYQKAMVEGRRFDLVVMDLSIPNGMGGAEAIQQIRHLDPEVVAIVSSGYSDDPVMANFRQYGFSAVLPKPYEPSSLRQLALQLINGGEKNGA